MSEQRIDRERADSAFALIVGEGDFEEIDRRKIEALLQRSRMLEGEEHDVGRTVLDSLPRAIAKRVEGIVPKNFRVAELELKMIVSGTVFGTGVSGEVTVKLAPTAVG